MCGWGEGDYNYGGVGGGEDTYYFYEDGKSLCRFLLINLAES